MIYESWPWRRDLLNDAAVLERWLFKPVSERRSVIIEKKMFMGAFAMRKLLESGKLSTATEARGVEIDQFPSMKKVLKHQRWEIHNHYDLQAGSKTTLPVRQLMNQMIHSFIFQEMNDDDVGSTSIVFTSDKTKDKRLMLIRVCAFVDLMRFIAMDNPTATIWRLDPETGERVEWRGHINTDNA
ncbi:hypothetical protein [Sphingobium yanoikuyae]|uniref:hypothetical protein n=1 Tax=Sphingobium yanoikuyae TaxID=13690 RepID=UPI0013786815|nr:hypothetical protein [Sphingobium yanoikuyae]NBB42340.1 hypothetical protein [Sphingobium yanoikuyae]